MATKNNIFSLYLNEYLAAREHTRSQIPELTQEPLADHYEGCNSYAYHRYLAVDAYMVPLVSAKFGGIALAYESN